MFNLFPPKTNSANQLVKNLEALGKLDQQFQTTTTTTTELDFAKRVALVAVEGLLHKGTFSDPKKIAQKAFEIAVELDKHFCDR